MTLPRSAARLAAVTFLTACVTEVELTRAPALDAAPTGPVWRVVATPTRAALYAVHGRGDEVWAVGAAGTALRWSGAALTPISTGTDATLTGVRVLAPQDVWVVGTRDGREGLVLRWDGASWRTFTPMMRTPVPLRAIWATNPGEVWVVGGDQATPEPGLWRWSPAGWRPEMAPQPRPVTWASVDGDGTDLWLTEDGASVWQRGATGWSPIFMGGLRPPTAGLCAAGEEVWYTTASAVARSVRGAVTPFAAPAMRALWCERGGETWAVGAAGRIGRFRGGAWTVESVGGSDLHAVWGAADGTRWAVGDQGALLRRSE